METAPPSAPAETPAAPVKRQLGLAAVVLVLLALVTWALGVRAGAEAKRRSLEGLRAAAAAAAVAQRGGAEPQALAEWIAREAGYRSVAFVTPEGRVVGATDSTLTTATPPPNAAEAVEHQKALWAPVRHGTGTAPVLWLRVVPAP